MKKTQDMKQDMHVLDFARTISMLTLNTPIALHYDAEYGQKQNRWWMCQREHLTVWCLHQPTRGVPGFEREKPNYSARKMYNYFGRPETLLWLAEALGEEKIKLMSIVEEIKNTGSRDACKIIRREVPFDRILSLIEKV